MAKEVKAMVKLQIPAGKANPAPPVGPALGQHGVNIMEFCKGFNERTKGLEGSIIPAVISIFADRTFTFVLKSPPASDLLRKTAGIAKGSAVPHKDKVASITKSQVEEIAKKKMEDMNAVDLAGACKTIEGSARSMGIEIKP